MNTPKQLTIEHLAAYLPYGVKKRTVCILPPCPWVESELLCGDLCEPIRYDFRLILRPLSDLTKEITHNGETFVPSERIDEMGYRIHPIEFQGIGLLAIPYWVVCKLHSWHFDIFGLIDAGLAIDINTINK